MKSGWRHTAKFAGSVHGVVVHMTTDTFLPLRAGIRSPMPDLCGNFTYTDGDVSSEYSTSASARAVSHDIHQSTGFFLLYTPPFSTNLPNSLMIVASYEWSMVRYGESQSANTPSRLNSSRCIFTYFSAYSRHSFLISCLLIPFFLGPSCLSTWCSIGSPWQSLPGG